MSSSVYPSLTGLVKVERQSFYGGIVQREDGGRELTVARQTAARYRYQLSYDFLRQDAGGDEYATLLNFFAAHKGTWDSFLFTDPKGATITAGAFGTGDGTTTVFYLRDEMGDRIGACNGTPAIYKAGALQTVTTHYTLDSTTGKVTFVTAPAAGNALTWTGDFYRRARFAYDELATPRRHARIWRADVELVSVLA